MLCVVPVLRGCVWYVLLLCKEEGFSPVSLQLLRGGIWACMKYIYLCLCWVLFWDRDYVIRLPYVWYYIDVTSSYMLVGNVSPRGHMCFRCLMFSLAVPCELLFFFILLPLGLELW